TNTVLMLVVECAPGDGVRRLADFARITRLGRGVDSNGRLDPAAAARTLETIVEFAEQARTLGADKIVAAGTAVLRDSSDGAAFLAQVKSRAGIDLEILSGTDEARLSYLAVVKGLAIDPNKRLLIADIGGGSTELIRAEPGAPLGTASLQIGSVRMTERIVRHDPPTAEERRALADTIDATLDGLRWDFRPEVLVGVAGTVTRACAVALRLERYDHDRVHGHRLTRTEVECTLERLAAVTLAGRKRLPGVEEGWADVGIAGVTILLCVMDKFGAESVVVSDHGVRWGLIWRELGATGGEA
ncbi:MAG: hypothetical protein WA005_13310, partial [Candidatus Binataceae bacterium]